MGNCLVIHQDREEIKIVSVDASQRVLKMTPSSSPITSSLEVVQEEALGGEVMSSLPSALPVPAAAAVVGDDPTGAVRVKLVISKRELNKVLGKEGMSLDDMVRLMREAASDAEAQLEEECCGGWRPALESIPEDSDL